MAKSVIVIAGIGGAGCLLLSLCMQKALGARPARQRSPVEVALESRFADSIVPPARLELLRREDGVKAVVHLTLRGNAAQDPIVAAAGALVWEKLRDMPMLPTQLTLVLADDVGSPRRAWAVAPPSPPSPPR